MKYSASIIVKGNPGNIYKCFFPEAKHLKSNRSDYKIEKNKEGVLFKISADDSVALRATLNSITKLLTVYEKLEKIK